QATGHPRTARHLRALSTALRLESLVRVVRPMATIDVGGQDAAASHRGKSERAATLSRRSIWRQPAATGENGALVILVHRPNDQARHGRLVEAATRRAIHGPCGR